MAFPGTACIPSCVHLNELRITPSHPAGAGHSTPRAAVTGEAALARAHPPLAPHYSTEAWHHALLAWAQHQHCAPAHARRVRAQAPARQAAPHSFSHLTMAHMLSSVAPRRGGWPAVAACLVPLSLRALQIVFSVFSNGTRRTASPPSGTALCESLLREPSTHWPTFKAAPLCIIALHLLLHECARTRPTAHEWKQRALHHVPGTGRITLA